MASGGQVNHAISNGIHFTDSSSRRSSTNNKEGMWLPPMESLNWLMHLYYTRGETQKARYLINQELDKSKGRNEFAHCLLGKIFADQNMLNEAIEEFRSCNKLCPTNIDYIKQIAKCLYQQKRYKLSLEALMEAENLATKLDWEIHYWIAECLTALGSSEAALEWSRRAARAGGRLTACAQLGALLAAAGDIHGAVQAYNAALQNAPDNVDLLTSVGVLHVRAGQQQLAVERLGSALALGPPQARALLPLAAIMQSHRDYDVALSRYKVAAQQTPDCAALWNNIGMCFFGKQKFVAAISCLKRAACLSPLSARILHNLGLVHLACSQPASAFQFLCAALNLRSGNSTSYMLMAITLDQLDDEENASKAYEHSVSMNPEDLLIRINYCSFLAKCRRVDLAREQLTTAEDIASSLQSVDKISIDYLTRLKSLVSPETSHKPDPGEPQPKKTDLDPIYETIHVPKPPAPVLDESATPEDFLDPDEV